MGPRSRRPSRHEMADGVGCEAANLRQDGAPVSLQSARARLRRQAHGKREERIQSTRFLQEVGPRRATPGERPTSYININSDRSTKRVRAFLASMSHSRRDSVDAAILRTGHTTLLAGYRHRIGQQNDLTCPERGDQAETLGHLLNARGRRRVFGRDDPTIKDALGTGLGWRSY